MGFHERIVRQLRAMIRFHPLSEFFHHATIRFHIEIIQSNHPGGMNAPENRRLLNQNHGLPCTTRCDRRSDSRRGPTDDDHVINAGGDLDRKGSFAGGLCLKVDDQRQGNQE